MYRNNLEDIDANRSIIFAFETDEDFENAISSFDRVNDELVSCTRSEQTCVRFAPSVSSFIFLCVCLTDGLSD